MAKRGLKKGSKCVRKHRNGRCAEFSSRGKARKGPGRPKKRKGGGKELSFLQQMERKFRRKKNTRMYSASDYAEKMREAREAEQASRLRSNIESFSPGFGGTRRRRRGR